MATAEAVRLALERRREQLAHAQHVDDLTQQIEALTAHGARLDNWVNALKGES